MITENRERQGNASWPKTVVIIKWRRNADVYSQTGLYNHEKGYSPGLTDALRGSTKRASLARQERDRHLLRVDSRCRKGLGLLRRRVNGACNHHVVALGLLVKRLGVAGLALPSAESAEATRVAKSTRTPEATVSEGHMVETFQL